MYLKKISTFLLLLAFSVTAFGWGANGHRIVGQIAETYLTKKARKAVRRILGNESVAIASNWADFVKSDSAYNYLSSWHYINLPSGMNFTEFENSLKNDTGIDIYTKLNFIIAELKKNDLPADKKKMYLYLLIHMVGDMHQPLHVGRAEDLGGNKIKVMWFNEPTNLHSVWDDKLIEMQKLSYTEYAASINFSTVEERSQLQSQPIAQWLFESYQLANNIYKGIHQPDQKLSFRYNYDNIAILNQQLLKGGIRLAGLLNEIFN